MPTQIISIDPLGNIETLKRKKGKGVDIAPLVKKQHIKRISLVEWDDESQKWFLRLQLGEVAGWEVSTGRVQALTRKRLVDLNCPNCDDMRTMNGVGFVCLWEDYDDAVLAEIEIIEQARLVGNGHLVGSATEETFA